MSIASLLGVVLGIALVVWSIAASSDNPAIYLDLHGFLMVVGGTAAAAFMSYNHRDVLIAFKAIGWMVKKPKSTREGLNLEIGRLIKWGYIVQAKGLPALENEIKSVKADDPVIKYCVELVVTNHKPDELRGMMETAVESEFELRTVPVQVLKYMASCAPAFGMIGTLVGLVGVLKAMASAEGAQMMQVVGNSMALALLATLYGVLSARLIFLPAGTKLLQKEETERFRNLMVIEGLVMLAEKKSPRYMQDRLNSFLEPLHHFVIDRQARQSAGKPADA